MFSFSKQLEYVKRKLKHWNRNCFGNLHIMTKRAQDRLDVITRQSRDLVFSEALGITESRASANLAEWDLREEIYWKQKAQVDWLQEGDKNIAFFHKSMQARCNKSCISSLVTSEGTRLTFSQVIFREAI